jgi:hypothetical protein
MSLSRAVLASFVPLFAIVVAGDPTSSFLAAQEMPVNPGKDLIVRIGGPVRVAAGDTAGAVIVINHDATVAGRLRDGLLVVNGTAQVTGAVDGAVVIVNGRVELGPGSRVGDDLVLYRSTVVQSPGAVIAGRTVNESGLTFGRRFLRFAWFAITLALMAAGVLFAAVGGKLLIRAVALFDDAPHAAFAGAIGAFVGLPIVAFLASLTVVGIALGIGIAAVLLPALWILGYLVAAAWFGRLALALARVRGSAERPYAAVFVGVLANQFIGLVPVLGGLVVLLVGAIGAGAIVSLAWRQWRGARESAPARTT